MIVMQKMNFTDFIIQVFNVNDEAKLCMSNHIKVGAYQDLLFPVQYDQIEGKY